MAAITRFEPLDDWPGAHGPAEMRVDVHLRIDEKESSATFQDGILALALPRRGDAQGTTLPIA